MPGWLRSGDSGRPTSMRSNATSIAWSKPHRTQEEDGEETMSNREKYAPGPAAGAEVRKDGEKWTLVLVRELRHPPAKVWQALTDPAHLSEWAPFDADRNLAAVGPVKLSTVGSADAAGLRDHREAGRGAEAARVQLGRQRPPLGAGAARAAAPASRSGTTSIAASSRGAPRAGTSASTSSIGSSPVSRLDASSAPRP